MYDICISLHHLITPYGGLFQHVMPTFLQQVTCVPNGDDGKHQQQEASPQHESASRSVVASPSSPRPRPTAIRSPANRASASDLADALALDAAPGAGVAIRPLLPVAIPVPSGGPGTADESAGVGSCEQEEIVVWFHERATLITGEAAQKWHRDLRDAIRRGPQRWTDFGMSVSLSRVACVPLHQEAAFFLRRLYTQSMVDSNIVGTSLAPPNMNRGRIIYHATKMINNILEKYEIGKFKVGVTVKPLDRFYEGTRRKATRVCTCCGRVSRGKRLLAP